MIKEFPLLYVLHTNISVGELLSDQQMKSILLSPRCSFSECCSYIYVFILSETQKLYCSRSNSEHQSLLKD